MELLGFIKKYLGKKIDYDKHFGAQCVDVFRQYCKDVLKTPRTESVVGAVELFTKYERKPLEKTYFEKIAYKGQKPTSGDVVIFGATTTNPYGHVAIVVNASEGFMLLFEQDGFDQKGSRLRVSDYKRCLGFLRRK